MPLFCRMGALVITKGVDKMDRQVLLRKIMKTGDEVRRLEQDLVALQSIDVVGYPENYSNLSQQAAIKAEYITRKIRELVYSTTNIEWPKLLEVAANELEILVYRDKDGEVDITLPCLIPARKKKPTEFITLPLYYALQRFVLAVTSEMEEECEIPFEKFKQCVICITHIYDKVLFGKGRLRDHDNKETKGIIDVINAFLLTDDNENFCDIYFTHELSDKDFTRISIMPRDMFYKRILDMKIG